MPSVVVQLQLTTLCSPDESRRELCFGLVHHSGFVNVLLDCICSENVRHREKHNIFREIAAGTYPPAETKRFIWIEDILVELPLCGEEPTWIECLWVLVPIFVMKNRPRQIVCLRAVNVSKT